jgi:hypothetical protein
VCRAPTARGRVVAHQVAFLRSRFHATGEVHNHLRISGAMDAMFSPLRRLMLARRALAPAGKLIGKNQAACRRP